MNNISNSLLRVLIVKYLNEIGYTYDTSELMINIELSNTYTNDAVICLDIVNKKFFCIISHDFNRKSFNDYITVSINDLIKNHRKVSIERLLNE
jgi:hypothetical protein